MLWAGLLAPFLAFGVVPPFWMALRALRRESLARAFGDPSLWPLLGRTISFSIAVAICATLLGTVAGILLGSTSWRGKTLARAIFLLPLAIPPYLHAIGWTTFLRPRGWVASNLSTLFSTPPSAITDAIYSRAGATFVLALAYFPIAMLFCEKSLALSSPSLTEAAQVFGASRVRAFMIARWPFLRPAVASSAMIVFLLAASDLGVPTILKVPVFNFEVFMRLGAFNDETTATLLALPLFAVGLLALIVERGLTVGQFLQADAQDAESPGAAGPAATWFNRGFFALLALIVLGLPFGSTLLEGFERDALTQMWSLAQRPAVATIQYSAATAAAITLAAFALASVLRSARGWRVSFTDWVLVAGFAVPSTIVALALLGLYDLPEITRWVSASSLVVAALIVRHVIVGYRIASAAVAQTPDALFEAAAVDGASSARLFWHVLLPINRAALVATASTAFVLAVGEIGSTILLYPPGGETLPIALYAIEANSPRAYVASLTTILLSVILIPLALAGILLRLATDLNPISRSKTDESFSHHFDRRKGARDR